MLSQATTERTYIGAHNTNVYMCPIMHCCREDNYPPKLSKRIMSSSTPRLGRRSSTVFAIIGGPQR